MRVSGCASSLNPRSSSLRRLSGRRTMLTRFNLSQWALEHQALILYFMLALFAAGIYSYTRLGEGEDPEFTFKVMVVRTLWPGATAREVEQQFTERLEKK